MSAVAEYVMPEDEARRLTERIRVTAHTYAEAREKLIGYVEEAKAGNAHLALGYRSWTEYLSEVLGEEPMRLARDERREVVQLLSSEGMSTRAIAPIVGASHDTVHRDLHAAPVRNLTPAPEPPTTPEGGTRSASTPSVDIANVDKETGEILADGSPEIVKLTGPNSVTSPGRTITGMDGKSYTRPEPTKPRRRPITDAFHDTAHDLRKITERLVRLTEDDRFPHNAEKVATANRSDLLRAIDALQSVINRLPEA